MDKISLDQFARMNRAERDAYLGAQWVQEYDAWDQELQANINTWGGMQECIACGELYDPSELSELGFCPSCTDELQEVDKLP